ncbi:hypothetical protein DM02DRAFT_100857, partial [Periconia macrospinosa]
MSHSDDNWCSSDGNGSRLERLDQAPINSMSSRVKRRYRLTWLDRLENHTGSWDRLRLRCTTIEMIECIGNWIRQRHIKPVWDSGMGLPIDPELQET